MTNISISFEILCSDLAKGGNVAVEGRRRIREMVFIEAALNSVNCMDAVDGMDDFSSENGPCLGQLTLKAIIVYPD